MTALPFDKYDAVIWDFNGTIIDDVGIGIESVNTLLRARGLKEISGEDEYRSLFGFPIIDYYRRLGFDFEKESFDALAVEWVSEYLSREKNAPVRQGIPELLAFLEKLSKTQTLISATEDNMLRGQIKSRHIGGFFESVMGMDNIRAGGKTSLMTAWRERHPDMKTVLIGDTLHDAEAAAVIGADCILVGGGHQPLETLIAGGNTVYSDTAALLRACRENNIRENSVCSRSS